MELTVCSHLFYRHPIHPETPPKIPFLPVCLYRLVILCQRLSFVFTIFGAIYICMYVCTYGLSLCCLAAPGVVLAPAVNQSCDDACAGRRCDVAALWLLNESCDVIARVVPGCSRCASASADSYADGVLPAVDAEGRAVCWRAYPHYISCETASQRYRRICVCRG